MLEKLREKLLAFIASDKDVPLLAGFSIGFYMMLFYYSRNFALANSLEQLLFFIGYYIVLPAVVLFAGYKILGAVKLAAYKKHFLFVGMIGFASYFLLQLNYTGFSSKIIFVGIILVAALLSFRLKKYYKLLILLFFLMSLFNIKPIAGATYKYLISSDEWKKLPDDIENVVFKKKPNIYYIQPDGYSSFRNLRENPLYTFDNSSYEAFLKQNGFTMYDDYRSNYPSTLLSNSATFSMKHHYIAKDVDFYGARAIIADNPALRILKNNGYKTSFITQNPYLIMNRPASLYDYCNISYKEISYLRDGFGSGISKNIFKDLKEQMAINKASGNFYFIQKFLPGHIPSFPADSDGKEAEQQRHMKKLKEASQWLKLILAHIVKEDPGAIIIVGADHGGFAGFANAHESHTKTSDKNLINSMFGAQLAIKWSDTAAAYDKDLASGINLFRTVFSFLAEDKKYLNFQEDNSSYTVLTSPKGIYKYFNDKGEIVCEKKQ